MATHNVNCPHCNFALEIGDDSLGQTINCPHCDGPIEVAPLETRRVEIDASSERRGFWQSIPGLVIRWIVFLPVVFVGTSLVQGLAAQFTFWATDGSLRAFVLFGILFGIGWPVFALAVTTAGMVVYLGCHYIAPKPKIATIIFGTLYGFGVLLNMFEYILSFSDRSETYWMGVFWSILMTITVYYVLVTIHTGSED